MKDISVFHAKIDISVFNAKIDISVFHAKNDAYESKKVTSVVTQIIIIIVISFNCFRLLEEKDVVT